MATDQAQNNRTVDVLIIGAGASGGAAAWRLAKDGFDVVILEQGSWMRPEDYPTTRNDWELKARTSWNIDPNVRGLPEDYPVNDTESDVTPLMYNAVGGSTIHWTAHTPRFHPSDFRVKSLDGVADDWPLTYEELEPWYDLNDRMMGCSGIVGDPANPPRSERPMPPLPIGPDGEAVARAFDALGWHWWPSDSYINSTRYDGRAACNNCGPNTYGCAVRAKASTDVTYLPKAQEMGVEIRTNSRVTEITTGPGGRVTGASYIDSNGDRVHQPARSVIMAANGVGTPRLLLLSRSKNHPDGLANSTGLVGKNLMFHPYSIVTGFLPEMTENFKGPLGNMILSQEFYETDPRRDFVRGYTYQIARSTGPGLTAIGMFAPPVSWGASHHEEFASRFGKGVSLAIISEDLPELHNCVTLDESLTDSDGIPAPRVQYKTSANTRKLLDHGIRNGVKVLEKANAHGIAVTSLLKACGWHLMGTAKMGDDPAASVVDKWGAAHDADNLFIVDGSVFVTAAAVNPTPTIQALALRTAEYICESRGDLKG